ncbi:hypothetical protein EPA93_14985 [Ktedonosporobacter rubrisoli]|uniref:asparagine synthase (glutamine-hydrolyzing) n=1 Tax=Ktedonosporobacter rubrisoli TaxID=2509675 RepID=A0A4P6JPC3_KTERU|nr:hypothetical protein [Ktedonosporobacter rubrisoli]QBD77229.1 hypothetical protein EPA93_14985 [Ktedonosporobacter rubrisoli]
MAQTVKRRGPDTQGCWLSPHAALAHHRLIVIDPTCAAQPMIYQTDNNTIAITNNGEMYNFRELRDELTAHGHIFQMKSDTEVILHVYTEWGEGGVKRLNGIFAFGLWNEQKQQ